VATPGLETGIDPLDAVRMLSTALHYDSIFTNSAARLQYTAQVLDIFIRGIAHDPGNAAVLMPLVFLPGSAV
jgi:hypothetical protein